MAGPEAVDTCAPTHRTAAQTNALPPAAAAPLPVPVAMLAQVLHAAATGTSGDTTEVMLDPVELGRLSITVSGEGGALSLTIQAERPDTLDLLRRHGDQLLADLRQAGLGGATLNFGSGGGRGRQPTQHTPAASGDAAWAAHRPSAADAVAMASAIGTAGLNLRL
ncbi:MAG: flagellar hook-length control protein FliK [Paracoccaceae bacterium]|nr:MAG: flagellar hook-length control protein FliK [Paracoccaceae bacterium]